MGVWFDLASDDELQTVAAAAARLRSECDAARSPQERAELAVALARLARDEQHLQGKRGWGFTVLCSHVLLPMLAHGSLLIYAPDCVLLKAWAARGALQRAQIMGGRARTSRFTVAL